MELKEAIGRRRSIRFLRPYKSVERGKIQKMLEAARLASFWGNVQALKAVVIERSSARPEVVAALPVGTAIGGFQFRAAPVVIVWCLDWQAVAEQGDRLHELVDAGALGIDKAKSHAYLDSTMIPFFKSASERIQGAGFTEIDCGQGIAQATLVAFEEGLGTCLLAAMNDRKMRKALKLPESTKIIALQTVGYPAEDPAAGGQRPRLPFEHRFFLNAFGEAFPRDPNVVEELTEARMLQAQAPLPDRAEELNWLGKAFGLGDVFGDEIPAIIKDLAQAAGEAPPPNGPRGSK
jgi:nitroreductase